MLALLLLLSLLLRSPTERKLPRFAAVFVLALCVSAGTLLLCLTPNPNALRELARKRAEAEDKSAPTEDVVEATDEDAVMGCGGGDGDERVAAGLGREELWPGRKQQSCSSHSALIMWWTSMCTS